VWTFVASTNRLYRLTFISPLDGIVPTDAKRQKACARDRAVFLLTLDGAMFCVGKGRTPSENVTI
jgi:hypothetical protein